MSIQIRPITDQDNPAIASIIREVMPEFGADGPGFAIHDPEVDSMSNSYAKPRSIYFVVALDNTVAGGGGIAPLEEADPSICELRKMYFLPKLRGLGAGSQLIRRCIDAAREYGYRQCYLETLTGMNSAQALYEKTGFKRIDRPMGATGHFGCNRFYLLDF